MARLEALLCASHSQSDWVLRLTTVAEPANVRASRDQLKRAFRLLEEQETANSDACDDAGDMTMKEGIVKVLSHYFFFFFKLLSLHQL